MGIKLKPAKHAVRNCELEDELVDAIGELLSKPEYKHLPICIMQNAQVERNEDENVLLDFTEWKEPSCTISHSNFNGGTVTSNLDL